jgi:hypothetical protein
MFRLDITIINSVLILDLLQHILHLLLQKYQLMNIQTRESSGPHHVPERYQLQLPDSYEVDAVVRLRSLEAGHMVVVRRPVQVAPGSPWHGPPDPYQEAGFDSL